MNNLRVLHINKFHHIIGGSEMVYFRTAEILERKGHRSIFFSMIHPDNLPCNSAEYFVPYIDIDHSGGPINLIRATGNVFYSYKTKSHLSKLLDRFEIDIAHVHNIHRQMSPSILHELKRRNIPVVMTLHEYKMVCPSFNLLINETPCEACAGGKYYNAIKLRCIKGSRFRSALASAEMYMHHFILDIYKNIDIFISPSMFLKNKHEEMGFKKEIVHLPNSIDTGLFSDTLRNEKIYESKDKVNIVYFGRLYYGKGLYTLLEAAKKLVYKNSKIVFTIIGDGPMREELIEKSVSDSIVNIKFLGYLKNEELLKEVNKAFAVVLTSECYENNPLQVIESFAMGIPVIGSRIAGIPELVMDNETGLTFEAGNSDDLCSKIEYLVNNPGRAAEMGRKARAFVEQELSAEKYYKDLMGIYERAISLVKHH